MYKCAAAVLLALAPGVVQLADAAEQDAWTSCATRPDNFVTVDSSTEQWPVGKIVVLEGFIESVEEDEYNSKLWLTAKGTTARVAVVAPTKTDTQEFGEDSFVRVQGLSTTLKGGSLQGDAPAVRLNGRDRVYGGIKACAPMHAAARKLADAGCGGGGQPICTGAQLDGRDPPFECDFGFVGGPAGTCIPFTPTDGGDPCGGGGQRLCTPDEIAAQGRDPPFECDFGFVAGDGGICVPFTPAGDGGGSPCGAGGQRLCTPDEIAALGRDPPFECDFGFVAGAGGICVPFTPVGGGDIGSAACGGGGQRICTADEIAALGRDPPFECDFGFVAGETGICVEFTPPGSTPDPMVAPTDGPCGGFEQRVCNAEEVATRTPPWECDFGFVGGPGGFCVPFPLSMPMGGGVCGALGQVPCTGDQLVGRDAECDAGLVGRVTETNVDGICVAEIVNELLENPPPAPPPPPPTCGQGGQPECAGDELIGRTFSCDFGFVPDDGICTPFVPDPPAECGVPGVDFGSIAIDGSFGPVIPFPLIPVATALLPSGQVLSWSGALIDQFGINGLGTTKWSLFDPASDTVSGEMTSFTDHDMFCPSISMLPDGKILVGGGNNAEAASIYTDGVGWEATSQMNIPRGYSSAVTLSNGQVFTNGGSWSGDDIINVGCCVNKEAEVYDPPSGTWRQLTGISSVEMLSDDPEGRQQQDYYGFFFAWTGATVFHAGPSTQMNWYSIEGDGFFIPAGERGPTAQNGGAVMYEAGKILVVGGGPAFGLSLPARTTAEVVEISAFGVPPTVRPIAGPLIPRTFSMSVVLPTGDVLHFGGNAISEQFSDDTAILQPELWNHESEQWQLLETPMAIPRTYHSSAVLVPDGRVYMGGGGLCFTCFPGQSGKICDCLNNHLDVEMYSPPYLFNEDGSPAKRPTITVDKGVVGLGETITVTSDEDILQVSMIRMGSSTHSVNLDQRRLELCGDTSLSCNCETTVTVTVPGEGIAIPGYWMVFVINAAGVPSVGFTVQVPL